MAELINIAKAIDIDVVGIKILGVKTHKINIMDAWKDKGVVLKQPLAAFTPPKEIEDLTKMGINASLVNKENIIKEAASKFLGNRQIEEIMNEIKKRSKEVHPAYAAIKSLEVEPIVTMTPPQLPPPPEFPITAGGAQFSLGDITGSISKIFSNAFSGLSSWMQSTFNQISSGVSGAINQVKRVWDALLHLSDLINDMYDFMTKWKDESDKIMAKVMELEDVNKTLIDLAHKEVVYNREFFQKIAELMDKSLAKYFDDLTFNLIKFGQVDVPTAIVGSLSIAIKNKSLVPLTATIQNLTIKSGPYTLYRGNYIVNMLPMESDNGELPFEVYGVEEAKYLLDRKKEGAIPLTVTGILITPAGRKNINISKMLKV